MLRQSHLSLKLCQDRMLGKPSNHEFKFHEYAEAIRQDGLSVKALLVQHLRNEFWQIWQHAPCSEKS